MFCTLIMELTSEKNLTHLFVPVKFSAGVIPACPPQLGAHSLLEGWPAAPLPHELSLYLPEEPERWKGCV